MSNSHTRFLSDNSEIHNVNIGYDQTMAHVWKHVHEYCNILVTISSNSEVCKTATAPEPGLKVEVGI